MTSLTASRTLVKSPPELWSECSDAASLARHLGAFGEIRITQLQPETAVAWEGAAARGTVRLEPSGWGTRVVLTIEPDATPDHAAGAAPEGLAEAEAEPDVAALAPVAAARPTLFARIMSLLPGRSVTGDAEPEPEPEPEPDIVPVTTTAERLTEDTLTEALDSLGRAHHRPYSRA